VREVLIFPAQTGSHDYLGCPEVVEDVAACFSKAYGVELADRYCAASTPVIVKFWSPAAPQGTVETALWYVFKRIRDNSMSGRAVCWGFSADGEAIPSDQIITVEARA
jgi:hypothetical protein